MDSQTDTVCDVARGRALVQGAYGESGGPSGSVMELFSGKGRNQKETLKPSPKVDGFSATRIHATETRRQGGAKEPQANGKSNGKVLQAIATLPPIEHLWVKYCYCPTRAVKIEAADRLYELIWDQYRKVHLIRHRRSTQEAVRALLAIQLYQCTSFAMLQHWDNHRPLEVRAYTEVDADSWRKKYRKHWQNLHIEIVALDCSAMRRVAQQCVY